MYLNHFVQRRGRPKLTQRRNRINKSQTIGLMAELKLKEILSERHYCCALNFQMLYKRYLISIEAPLIGSTMWDSVGSMLHSRGYRYTEFVSKQDTKLRNNWYKINEYLKRKLMKRYDLFLHCILWEDHKTALHITKSQQLIDLIQEGLSYLDG